MSSYLLHTMALFLESRGSFYPVSGTIAYLVSSWQVPLGKVSYYCLVRALVACSFSCGLRHSMNAVLDTVLVLRIVSCLVGYEDAETKHCLDQLLPHMPCLVALHLEVSYFEGFEGFDFSANSGLRFIDVRGNGLDGWDAQGTSSLCSLSALYLGGNRLSAQGLESLAPHFSSLISLQSISLGHDGGLGNSLRDSGAAVLAQNLSALVCLTQIGLRSCKIGDAGVCALASSLRSALCLKAVDMESNPVGSVGLRGLAQGPPRCTTLRSLALGWCETHFIDTDEGD